MAKELNLDDESKNRIFQQAMDLWILPEIEKRKNAGRLEEGFTLRRAQVIFSHDRRFPKVRLNQQIKANARTRVKRNVVAGEPIYEEEVDNIEDIHLTDQDPNCAHFTLLLFKGKWYVSFDFRYNRKRVLERLDAAKEFLESTRENYKNDRLRPFFENSFAVAEILTEALLIQVLEQSTLKDHKKRSKRLKMWVDLGNAKKEFSELLNSLWRLRDSARYMSSTQFKKEKPKEYLDMLDEMYVFVQASISR